MPARHVIATLLIVGSLAACAGTPSPSPSPDPVDPDGFVLRATMSQALPPESTFSWLPLVLITADGRVISVGPTDASFPGRLLPNLLERSISQAGWNSIANAARAAGLLSGKGDFTGGGVAPGGALGHLELVVDGQRYELTGDPAAHGACTAPGCAAAEPGSPQAFAQFWSQLSDLTSAVGSELGPERPYVASSYAILVGPPVDQQGLGQPPLEWPLDQLDTFGEVIAAGDGRRCGVVSGEDAVTLRPALEAATSISHWFDEGGAGAGFSLVVRPILPGDEDPCAALAA